MNRPTSLTATLFAPAAIAACSGAPTSAGDTPPTATAPVAASKATMITLRAAEGETSGLRGLLTGAGPLVARTEPGTLEWFALETDRSAFGIFDLFPNVAGRDAHFGGQVAGVLNAQADKLVDGGWDAGVLQNVRHYDVLVTTAVRDPSPALATYIVFRAREGQEEALAKLLTGAGDLVWKTEPGTLFWTALRDENDPRTFAIYDTFAEPAGRDAHFAGQVAGALRSAADTLVEGGWQGVVAGVNHYEIRATN